MILRHDFGHVAKRFKKKTLGQKWQSIAAASSIVGCVPFVNFSIVGCVPFVNFSIVSCVQFVNFSNDRYYNDDFLYSMDNLKIPRG